MIDELEIVRRAFDAPAQDPEARERALARLREAMASGRPPSTATRRPRRKAHPARWLGVAAAIVASLLVANSLFPPHHGHPSASGAPKLSPKATAALRRAAAVASAGPPTAIPAGQYMLVSSADWTLADQSSGTDGGTDVTTGQSFHYSVEQTSQTWLAHDGSGFRVSTITDFRFASAQDHLIWIAMLRPDIPRKHDVLRDDIAPGDLTHGHDMALLPTDASELESALRSTTSGELDDEQVMKAAVDILIYGKPSPAQRGALFKVLADLPGIRIKKGVADPSGRIGTAMLLPQEGDTKEVIFDPETSFIMATLELAGSYDGTPLGSQTFDAPSIVDQIPPRFTT